MSSRRKAATLAVLSLVGAPVAGIHRERSRRGPPAPISMRRAELPLPVSRQLTWFAAVGAALLAVLLPGLGSAEGGTHPDETLYLTIAEEMHARGAWLTPTLYGSPSFVKPPLLYWVDRLSYAVLGPTMLAGRLPVALCAAGLCLLVAALARRMFGERAALAAALLAAST
ncbi:MAG TPA: glycosyltransferase family 39 protein, partial [Myxococcaceae bacterium]